MPEAQAFGFVLGRSPLRHGALLSATETLTRPSHAGALSLIETWRHHAARGGMIVGRHFPLRRHAAVLPDVVLFERCARDFRVRLAGFAMLCFHGYELRGKRLSEIHGDARYRRELEEVIAERCPHISRRRLQLGGETVCEREILALPVLASDGCTPLVLEISFWTNRVWLN
jgi:hypothetical protein